LSNCREFVGFILGILSQNSDITHIYVDGLSNIVCSICDSSPDAEELKELKARLDSLSTEENVEFILSIHCNKDDLPEELKSALI